MALVKNPIHPWIDPPPEPEYNYVPTISEYDFCRLANWAKEAFKNPYRETYILEDEEDPDSIMPGSMIIGDYLDGIFELDGQNWMPSWIRGEWNISIQDLFEKVMKPYREWKILKSQE